MAVAYVDPDTVSVPATGVVAPAALGTTYRNNFEALIQPPGCTAYASAAQSVPTATFTTLTLDSERYDNDGIHSTVTNTSRLTIQKSGIYLFTTNLQFQASAATRVTTSFYYNATTRYERDVTPAVGGATDDRHSITMTFPMTAGDYMEVQANQNSGGNINITCHEFSCLKISR